MLPFNSIEKNLKSALRESSRYNTSIVLNIPENLGMISIIYLFLFLGGQNAIEAQTKYLLI